MPLVLILFMVLTMNIGGSGSTGVQEYNYSFIQTQYYYTHVLTYRLKKSYFVNERTAMDLRANGQLKMKVSTHYQ